MTKEELRQELQQATFKQTALFLVSEVSHLLVPVVVGWSIGVISMLGVIQALGLHR